MSRFRGACYWRSTLKILLRRRLISPKLSRRESEVLSWVAQGKTNSDIGTVLGISRRTVDTVLARVYEK
jgi:DNA-binding CsgD family transcriptional regulator